MNVDTGQFEAIRGDVDELGADVDALGTDVAQVELHMMRMVDLMRRMVAELAPAVRHAANLQRQPRPRGRHRGDSGGQRRDRRPPRCRDVP